MVGSNVRSSCLDHIYVRVVDLVHNITHVKPCFGDHELIMFKINLVRPPPRITVSRNWNSYSKARLGEALSLVDWSNNLKDVQSVWNDFETKLIRVVDDHAPLMEFKNNTVMIVPNFHIKRKLNTRKILLNVFKRNPTLELKARIKNLNFEIRTHYYSEKRKNVRKNLIPGNSKSLWKAVNTARDTGVTSIPCNLTYGNITVGEHERSDYFASFLKRKLKQSQNKYK